MCKKANARYYRNEYKNHSCDKKGYHDYDYGFKKYDEYKKNANDYDYELKGCYLQEYGADNDYKKYNGYKSYKYN